MSVTGYRPERSQPSPWAMDPASAVCRLRPAEPGGHLYGCGRRFDEPPAARRPPYQAQPAARRNPTPAPSKYLPTHTPQGHASDHTPSSPHVVGFVATTLVGTHRNEWRRKTFQRRSAYVEDLARRYYDMAEQAIRLEGHVDLGIECARKIALDHHAAKSPLAPDLHLRAILLMPLQRERVILQRPGDRHATV